MSSIAEARTFLLVTAVALATTSDANISTQPPPPREENVSITSHVAGVTQAPSAPEESCVDHVPVLRTQFSECANALHQLAHAVDENLDEYGSQFFLKPIAGDVKNGSSALINKLDATLQTAAKLTACSMNISESNAQELSTAQQALEKMEQEAKTKQAEVSKAAEELKPFDEATKTVNDGLTKAKQALETARQKLKDTKCGVAKSIISFGFCPLMNWITGRVKDAEKLVQENEQKVRNEEERARTVRTKHAHLQEDFSKLEANKAGHQKHLESVRSTKALMEDTLAKSIAFRDEAAKSKTQLDKFQNHAAVSHSALSEEVYLELSNILQPLDEMRQLLQGLINTTTTLLHGGSNATAENGTGPTLANSEADAKQREELRKLGQKFRRTKADADRINDQARQLKQISEQLAAILNKRSQATGGGFNSQSKISANPAANYRQNAPVMPASSGQPPNQNQQTIARSPYAPNAPWANFNGYQQQQQQRPQPLMPSHLMSPNSQPWWN